MKTREKNETMCGVKKNQNDTKNKIMLSKLQDEKNETTGAVKKNPPSIKMTPTETKK